MVTFKLNVFAKLNILDSVIYCKNFIKFGWKMFGCDRTPFSIQTFDHPYIICQNLELWTVFGTYLTKENSVSCLLIEKKRNCYEIDQNFRSI